MEGKVELVRHSKGWWLDISVPAWEFGGEALHTSVCIYNAAGIKTVQNVQSPIGDAFKRKHCTVVDLTTILESLNETR